MIGTGDAMSKRAIPKSVLKAAERAPRRRCATLAVTRDGVVKLSVRVERPVVWFEANHYAADGETGRGWWSDTDYTVIGFVDSVPSVLVYVTDRRVESVTLSVALAPYQLDLAVAGMRRCGLGRFVLPALRETQRQLRDYRRETPAHRAYFRRALRGHSAPRRTRGN
jgi:hypothetical protein